MQSQKRGDQVGFSLALRDLLSSSQINEKAFLAKDSKSDIFYRARRRNDQGLMNPASCPSRMGGSSRNPTWANLQTSFIVDLIAGSEVVIAHNVLDVSSALDVTLFSHMTIRHELKISHVLHEVENVYSNCICPGAIDLQLKASPSLPPHLWIVTPLDREP